MRMYPEASPKLRALVEHLRARWENPEAMRWAGMIREALMSEQFPGGLSGWADHNDSKRIEVLQGEFDRENHLLHARTPGAKVAIWNPMGIQFFSGDDRTDRKFRGVLTLGSSPTIYLGYDRTFGYVLVYHVVEDAEPAKV
jgi:hypothetical protein